LTGRFGMLMSHAVIHACMVTRRVFVLAMLTVLVAAADRAQHGGGHRTPDREQDRQHQQQPETSSFHDQQT
jgi:hypothetical protein